MLLTLDNTLDTQGHVVSEWSQSINDQLLEIVVVDKLSCNVPLFVLGQVQDVSRSVELKISDIYYS
jgi:hypothetical protein